MKIKNFTALVCMLFVAQLSFGQITLEHKYINWVRPVYKQYGDPLSYKYMIMDRDAATVTIYNLDHSIYKTVSINVPDGGTIYSAYPLYTNVVNEDPLLEFYYDVSKNGVSDTYIMNEDGSLIKKIEGASSVTIQPTESGFKLLTYYEVYSLPTTPNNISSVQSESAKLPYPNPAKQTITIPYQLSGQWGTISIYNASGQFVEQKNVDKNFSNLLLDVSGYAKGMYYYKVDKQKGEFMVN